MYEKFGRLQFVIGLFFSITAVILAISASESRLNLYTAIAFLLFGLAMMFLKSGVSND